MSWRADPQQIEDQKLAVGVPSPRQEPLFWCPSMGKIFLAAIHHPGEIDVIENFGRQEDDLRVVAKTRASSENTGQENCRVDRGYLTIGCPGSCLRVHEMVKPA